MSNKNFPQYISNRRIADKGVTFVKTIIENEFDWIFRPTHQEDDFGIDGFFDIIKEDNSVTGKYLGTQIKTGESYFKTKKSFGWVFNGENKHLNYYLNLNFPVIIVIVNLEQKKAYWAEFNIDKTTKTTTGWSMIIPESNILDFNSKEIFENLAGDTIDYMSQIEYQWEMNEKIKNHEIVVLNISKKEIESQDVSGFVKLLDKLTMDEDMINKTRGKITFLIDGYNDDSRELYQISEVKEWFKKVLPTFKYWSYFLNMEDYVHKIAGLRVLQACLVDLTFVEKDVENEVFQLQFNYEQSIELMTELLLWLNEFCDKYSISEIINKEQTDLVALTLLGFDPKTRMK
jgi:hypothetical protein